VVEHLHSKNKALSSNPSTAGKKKRKVKENKTGFYFLSGNAEVWRMTVNPSSPETNYDCH
jgi:hypothetical protein